MRAALALAAVIALAASGAAASADGRPTASVTLSARPTTLTWSQSATLFGAVDSREAGQRVTIEVKSCPLTTFREVTVAETGDGGTFTLTYGVGVNTAVRAVWRSATSAPVELRKIPRLQLHRFAAGKFQVGVSSNGTMWRKKVQFQHRAGGKWVTVKTVALTKTIEQGGGGSVWTEAEFSAKVPRGRLVRAVLPASQAKPCYLAGVSNTVRA